MRATARARAIPNFAQPVLGGLYFRWFRWLLGLLPKAPPSHYDRYQYMPNKRSGESGL